MKRLSLRCVLLAGALAGTSCADSVNSEEMRVCQQNAQASPALLLIGTEGTTEICQCTVDSVATRFPDAADKWSAYGEELQSRMERRGIVGFMVDTNWQNSKGREMASFAQVQGEILASCSQKLIKDWSGAPKN